MGSGCLPAGPVCLPACLPACRCCRPREKKGGVNVATSGAAAKGVGSLALPTPSQGGNGRQGPERVLRPPETCTATLRPNRLRRGSLVHARDCGKVRLVRERVVPGESTRGMAARGCGHIKWAGISRRCPSYRGGMTTGSEIKLGCADNGALVSFPFWSRDSYGDSPGLLR
jgi:hypothetical protein